LPRQPRVDGPGLVHHLMVRGIERRAIFLDRQDREVFLARFELISLECSARTYAWALMPNHAHLVTTADEGSISKVMARLGTAYAMYFNRRYARSGHLFQNRFKSRVVTSDEDLMNLIRYVHRNPLEAHIVRSSTDLEAHVWCGHGALVGTLSPRGFHDVAGARHLFGANDDLAIASVREFMEPEPEIPEARLDDQPAVAAPSQSGGTEEPPPGTDKEPFERLLIEVAAAGGLAPAALRGRSKRPAAVRCRDILCFRASRELGMRTSALARELALDRANVRRARARGAGTASAAASSPAAECTAAAESRCLPDTSG
jgi:putative transposase